MRVIIFFVFLLSSNFVFSQSRSSVSLKELDSILEKQNAIVREKTEHIEQLRIKLREVNEHDSFFVLENIYEEYKSFKYDSAIQYALKLQSLSRKINDPAKIATAKINVAFVLVSSGLLNEALDTLHTVQLKNISTAIKTKYYHLQARTCYDLFDFVQNDSYGRLYAGRGNSYVDSALSLLPANSVNYLLLQGLKVSHLGKAAEAKAIYEDLIKNYTLTQHEYAIVSSTLSFLNLYLGGDKEKSKELLIQAAIADIKTSTKETVAMLELAKILYKEGEFESAYKYIKVAIAEADFYGARQRKVQIAAIFPVIEAAHLSMVEAKRKSLLLYSALITIFSLLIIGFSVVIYRQNKRLQAARKIISQANESLIETNDLLNHTNGLLTNTNHLLLDANTIKDEYLWYYFNTSANYITKLSQLKDSIELNATIKNIDKIRYIGYNINIKIERESLYHNFDSVFVKLFPDFVNIFNSLLPEEHRIILKEGQLLNTELRIFALIRLGINDHEKIAKILDYTVTTIYTYKARIKHKSIYANEEFDQRIMNIRTLYAGKKESDLT
jgi:predicted negative regulator of RcsB-dependent stress response